MGFPLRGIINWAPFRLDALGLVTMLAAEHINLAVGRLVRSRYTEFLPFLSEYVIASDKIVEEESGFSLYNVTDFIHTTDIKGWFTRWLKSQHLKTTSRTEIHIKLLEKPISTVTMDLQALVIGLALMLGVLALSILIGDWYGVAASLSMLISVTVRRVILQDLRDDLDVAMMESIVKPGYKAPVKLLITMPNSKLVSLYTSRGIVIECLTQNRPFRHPLRHTIAKSCGWIAFVVLIVALGMCSLAIQLYIIILLVGGSLMLLHGWGAHESVLGHQVSLCLHAPDIPTAEDKRLLAYSNMQLQPTEEKFLVRMGMLPQPSNTDFWERYEKAKVALSSRSSQTVAQKDRDGKAETTLEVLHPNVLAPV